MVVGHENHASNGPILPAGVPKRGVRGEGCETRSLASLWAMNERMNSKC